MSDNLQLSADGQEATVFTTDRKANISGPDSFQENLEVVQKDSIYCTIQFTKPHHLTNFNLQLQVLRSHQNITIPSPALSWPWKWKRKIFPANITKYYTLGVSTQPGFLLASYSNCEVIKIIFHFLYFIWKQTAIWFV